MASVVKYKTTSAGKTDLIDASGATVTNALKLGTSGGAESAFSNDTIGTTAEDGYITIVFNGTTYKIPFWEDD